MKIHIPSSQLWPTLLLTGLVAFSSVAQASGTKTCNNGKCGSSASQSEGPLVPMAMPLASPQANTMQSTLKKSVTRFSGGAASLRQQVIQQNKTGKAQ